jgi:crotonobetainyl-CoA:carnitine CoA-transferase CaiB-like acyl-CoA transferase
MRLAKKADVVVENYRARREAPARCRLRETKAVNPRIVYGSDLGLRPGRPLWAARPGVDQIAQGMGGLMSITGEPGQGRCGSAFPIAT